MRLLLLQVLLAVRYMEASGNPMENHITNREDKNTDYRKKTAQQTHRLIGGHLKLHETLNEDSELLSTLSSSTTTASGQHIKRPKKLGDDEERKTLSQQVADGKYGLIHNEIFQETPPKHLGVISYDANPDVPKDNINSLGGLTKGEIWLAENHLLVLKGGSYENENSQQTTTPPWKPIDNYVAPLRPVKIPLNPKIPPPFPVQFYDNGPLHILVANASKPFVGPPNLPHFHSPFSTLSEKKNTQNSYPTNTITWPQTDTLAGKTSPNIKIPSPPFINSTYPSYFASFPPGTAIVPPPQVNQSLNNEDDDTSIFYPPSYTFYYPKDNSSYVAPGPLVPGIVLPPPPNFFSLLETTTPQPPSTKRPKITLHYPIVHEINNELKPVVTTTAKPRLVVTFLPHPTRNRTRTVIRPIKTLNRVKPFEIYGPPVTQLKNIKTTTVTPSRLHHTNPAFLTTVAPVPVQEEKLSTTTPMSRPSYFFYEEPKPETTTKRNYFPNPVMIPFFPERPAPPTSSPPHYIYVSNARPHFRLRQPHAQVAPHTPSPLDTFSIHISRLQKQIQYFNTPKPIPKPVYQYSFEAADYQSRHPYINTASESQFRTNNDDPIIEDKFRPLPKYSVQIQPATEITAHNIEVSDTSSEKPMATTYHHHRPAPKPISQYSFQAQSPNHHYHHHHHHYRLIEPKQPHFVPYGRKLHPPMPPHKQPLPLHGDIKVNYVQPPPSINTLSESINQPPPPPSYYRYRDTRNGHLDIPSMRTKGSFISYQLPGDDGAHFYFITPQLAQSRKQGTGFYYSQQVARMRRDENEETIATGQDSMVKER